ncbi:MAG: diguanylate cyclase (GGDEF)-like protein [Alteromonadaceae bacterium]|jgi:diguanylate cyclase (GGDEF)-like protein
MNISLSQQIYIFTASCCFLFAAIVMSVLWTSQTVELALSRDNYAQQVNNQTNNLQLLVVSDDIYARNYNTTKWLNSQQSLSHLLELSPILTPRLQTIQNSIYSQNKSVKRLFNKITENKLINASVTIKEHLKARLITQLEAIRSDSFQLSATADKNIHETIKRAVVYTAFLFVISIAVLLHGAFKLNRTFRTSMNEVKKAFETNRSGHFQKIQLSIKSQEFESIANAFNSMNQKLSETTVSLEVMKKMVAERTHVLEEISNTDPLTKVANRRALFERGNMEFSRATRNHNELALLLLDCDLFKNINDQFGHLVGDKLLIHICDICSKEIRDIDFLGRYGGEEFIIILPNCDLSGGVEIATRIQQSLAKHPKIIEGKEICATLSIGISVLNEKHHNLEQLINDADKAMYQAKKNGRNRIEVSTHHSLH